MIRKPTWILKPSFLGRLILGLLIGLGALGCVQTPCPTTEIRPPRLYRVVIQVSDSSQALAFYEAVLGVRGLLVDDETVTFDCDGTILVCQTSNSSGRDFSSAKPDPNPETLYFSVVNLDETLQRAKEASCRKVDSEIQSRTYGERGSERCFFAEDPFGNQICFVDDLTVFLGK